MTAPGKGPIEELRRYAAALRAEARAEHDSAAIPAVAGRSVSRRYGRIAIAAGAAVVFAVFNVGVAFAVDSAVPGDAWYPLDRAYERVATVVGLSPDLVAERFDEAAVLLASGHEELALEAAAEGMKAASDDPQLAAAAKQFAVLQSELESDAQGRFTVEITELVDEAHLIADIAQFGEVPRYAAHEVSVNARDVTEAARSDNPGNGPPDENPGQGNGPPDENPGQGNGPPDENPGQGNGPPDENPGQGNDKDKDKDKGGKP